MKLVLVYGHDVRNRFSPDFPVLSDSEPYIPAGEVWVDQAYISELDLFMKAYEEWSKLPEELTYMQWREEVCRRILPNPQHPASIPNLRLRTENIAGVTICIVNGPAIRRRIDPLFQFGGHGHVYSYIPKDEIWLDSTQDGLEFGPTLAHELCERELMAQGRSYDFAHDYALMQEKRFRRMKFGEYEKQR